MLKPNGAAELTAFTEKSYKETITPIVPGIWHVLGIGHSNAVIIEGRTSVILVDTLDTLERGQKLLEIIRSRTEKPVKTILYTHGHPDHRGGAGAFSGTDPEIIAFAPATPVLKKTEMLQDIQNLRGIRQFGYALSDEENMLLAIIENMQREDLNPIEEAEGINQMIETYGLTQDQVSKSVGKSRPYITNCLRLLKLPEAIQSFVSEGQLSAGHARAIVSAGNKEKQIALAEKAVKEGLSVRQIEKLAKDSKTGKAKAKPREKNADVKRVENDLKEALGTKVTLNQKGKKGKIEIEYYSKDDLERLIELLKTLH